MTDFGGVDNTVEDPFGDTTVFDAAELVDEKICRSLLLPFTALEQRQFLTNNT